MNNPAHSIAVLNCGGNANRPELSRTVPSRAEPYRTMQWKSAISEKRLRWLGHVRRMGPGRIPRDLLYGELAEGSRLIGRPRLRYKDICKKDMKLSDINIDTWESRAEDRSAWHFVVRQGVQKAEETRIKNLATKRVKRKEKQLQPQLASSSSSSFICRKCSRDCHSSIGLYSHSRRCR